MTRLVRKVYSPAMPRLTVLVGVAFACFCGLLVFNALSSNRINLTLKPCSKSDKDFIELTQARLARFQDGLRFKTITYDQGKQNYAELKKLVAFIQQSYPAVHSKVQHWVINKYSLLYKVTGSDAALLPALFMSHLDVVPTENQNWTKPHFAANVDKDGYVYARGTIDDKNGVFGILEALEYLAQQDWHPKRTFYVAFGHDEEAHGFLGAKRIAKFLRDVEKVKKLEFISDEGMVIVDDLIPGFRHPVAVCVPAHGLLLRAAHSA